MATYTAAQLNTGIVGEDLAISTLKTFTFLNSGYSSYFTLETIPNSNGFFHTGSSTNASGAWVVSSSMGFVSSPYVASVVVQPGTSSLTFTPAIAITGSNYRLRGTGNYSLTIT